MPTSPCVPSMEGFLELMNPYVGMTAHIAEFAGPRQPSVGNNGDLLLDKVMHLMLRSLRITLAADPSKADLLLVRPGGSLLDRYRVPAVLASKFSKLPDLPLVILPHSSWFENWDPASMFAGRTAPTLWISRDRRSYDHLRDDWGSGLARAGVELALDHDMVVTGRDYLYQALTVGESYGDPAENLLVARMGMEAQSLGSVDFRPATAHPIHRARRFVLRSLPTRIQHPVRRRTTATRQRDANEDALRQLGPGLSAYFKADPGHSFDISDVSLCTYTRYAHAILTADRVVTNRLHVGIPAALLGKRTWLLDSGYHKLRGVYEHSLAGVESLTFVSRSGPA